MSDRGGQDRLAGSQRTGHRRSGDPAQSSLVLLQITSGTGSGGSRRGLGLSGGGRPSLSGGGQPSLSSGGRLGHSRRRSYEEVLVSLAFHLVRLRAREGLYLLEELGLAEVDVEGLATVAVEGLGGTITWLVVVGLAAVVEVRTTAEVEVVEGLAAVGFAALTAGAGAADPAPGRKGLTAAATRALSVPPLGMAERT